MLPVLHIGPLALQTPGLIILVGIWLGITLIEKQAVTYHVAGDVISNLVFLGLIVGVIGARLAYVIHYSSVFQSNPASLISLNLSLFDPVWGIILGIAGASLYGWRKGLSLRGSLDALTGGLAIFAIFFYLAQFASGDGYGSPTSLPWAVELWGAYRHPVQIYEMLAASLILWVIWPRPGWFEIPGQRFLVWVALSAGATVFLEAFHGDSVLWAGFRSVQIIAWVILAISLWAGGKLKSGEAVPEEAQDE